MYGANAAISDLYMSNTEALHTSNFTPSNVSYMDSLSNNGVSWTENSIENVIGGTGNDILTGTAADNQLTGGPGNDTLSGATGNDNLSGGADNDFYLFAQGNGVHTVSDSAGSADKILWDSTVSQSNVAMYLDGSGNLKIGYVNSTDLITIQGQSTSGTTVERFELSNGNYMTAAEVNQVISTMAAYATANGINFTSLEDVKSNSNLLAIVNAGWHS